MIRLALFALLAAPIYSQAFDTVTFITNQDSFTVKKSGSHYSVDGKPVQSETFKSVGPLLTGPAMDDCPDIKEKPQVTAKVSTNGQTVTREFFVRRGLVRIDGKCLSASGEGLYFLPMHRRWLVGPFSEHVVLKSPLKLLANGNPVVSLVQRDGEWFDTHPQTELDWNFFDQFRNSLTDYHVSYRVLPDAAKDKPALILQSGSEKYKLYQLTQKLWAIERPGTNWLDASESQVP